jgi:hypothetical protein
MSNSYRFGQFVLDPGRRALSRARLTRGEVCRLGVLGIS